MFQDGATFRHSFGNCFVNLGLRECFRNLPAELSRVFQAQNPPLVRIGPRTFVGRCVILIGLIPILAHGLDHPPQIVGKLHARTCSVIIDRRSIHRTRRKP